MVNIHVNSHILHVHGCAHSCIRVLSIAVLVYVHSWLIHWNLGGIYSGSLVLLLATSIVVWLTTWELSIHLVILAHTHVWNLKYSYDLGPMSMSGFKRLDLSFSGMLAEFSTTVLKAPYLTGAAGAATATKSNGPC